MKSLSHLPGAALLAVPYGVRFPMFTTMSVKGSGAHPLFAGLTIVAAVEKALAAKP